MIHLLQPANSDEIRFADFIHPSRIRITGAFFSVLFNLQKFMLFEQRDPNTVKQENNEGGVTCVHSARHRCGAARAHRRARAWWRRQWDRFAQIEYARLACEDDDTQDGARARARGAGPRMTPCARARSKTDRRRDGAGGPPGARVGT